jgi:hypothetical protein
MGIELYPKFLSLAETRCYQLLYESIVCQLLPKIEKWLTAGTRYERS